MNVYFPTWLTVTLVVIAAGIAYTEAQTSLHLGDVATYGLGLGQVLIATLLGFQRATTNAVRAMRGKPTVAPTARAARKK